MRRATRGWTLNINGPIFLSTLSLRRATRKLPIRLPTALHFYPRSPCGERRFAFQAARNRQRISIHALLAESDASSQSSAKSTPISIHALLAESDRICQGDKFRNSNFYPRSPCGERLKNPEAVSKYMIFLSTLSLRRATSPLLAIHTKSHISIHALLAESDHTCQYFL